MEEAQLSDTDIATLDNHVWLHCNVISKYSFEIALTLINYLLFSFFHEVLSLGNL